MFEKPASWTSRQVLRSSATSVETISFMTIFCHLQIAGFHRSEMQLDWQKLTAQSQLPWERQTVWKLSRHSHPIPEYSNRHGPSHKHQQNIYKNVFYLKNLRENLAPTPHQNYFLPLFVTTNKSLIIRPHWPDNHNNRVPNAPRGRKETDGGAHLTRSS